MSLTLYKGPAQLDYGKPSKNIFKDINWGDVLVSMDRTDTMLRFDILRRLNSTAKWELVEAYVFETIVSPWGQKSLSVRVAEVKELSENNLILEYVQFGKEHHDYLQHITGIILDTSAHKVVKKNLISFLRQIAPLDTFDFISDCDTYTLNHIYPLLDEFHWGRKYKLGTDKNLERALRKHTVAEMTRAYFGKPNYRKDLVKGVAIASQIELVYFTGALKNLVPIDWIISLLKSDSEIVGNIASFDTEKVRDFYTKLSAKQLRRMVKCFTDEPDINVDSLMDVIHIYDTDFEEASEFFQDIKFRSFAEYHHAVMRIHNAVVRERERKEAEQKYLVPIPDNRVTTLLKSVAWDGAPYRVVFAETPYDIQFWGRLENMDNCIGNYAMQAVTSESTVYFALYKDDKVFVNIKATDYTYNHYRHVTNENEVSIEQFYEKSNSEVNLETTLDFYTRMILSGLITDIISISSEFAVIRELGYDSIEALKTAFTESNLSVSEFIERNVNARANA